MAKIYTIFNQKGGVGKTTTVINLAHALSQLKKKVLVLDMDPQGNTTSGLGVDKDRDYMTYDFIMGEEDVEIYQRSKNLDLIPSGGELAGIEIELATVEGWQYYLAKALTDIRENYDYIIIDSPPSLGILSLMSLTASDGILIPVQAEYYALEGVSQLITTINMVRDNFNENIELTGVVMTMYDKRNRLSGEVKDEIDRYFEGKVFNTLIPRNVRLAEAPSYGKTIFEYDGFSRGALAYKKLAKELIKRD